MGTVGPTQAPPRLTVSPHSQAQPTRQRAAPVGSRDPTCRKVPGEKCQGFPSGRSWRKGSRAWRGLGYIFVTPG